MDTDVQWWKKYLNVSIAGKDPAFKITSKSMEVSAKSTLSIEGIHKSILL